MDQWVQTMGVGANPEVREPVTKGRKGEVAGSGVDGKRGLLRILTINVNGLRDSRKFLAFEDFVARERPDILIVTETHLTKREARNLAIKSYLVITESSMPEDGPRVRGGVVILVRVGVTCEELVAEDTPALRMPLYSCAIIVYLNDD